MPTYPEHDKLRAVKENSQVIGEFLDWLINEQHVVLATHRGHILMPVVSSIQKWLARYFDIDEDRLEDEKRAILAEIRASG